ncbi:MAG: hypothetical protein AB7F75_08155 [Planctomycetota bacterium]
MKGKRHTAPWWEFLKLLNFSITKGHQGLDGNVPVTKPVAGGRKSRFGHHVKSRLGGLLNYYFNTAA